MHSSLRQLLFGHCATRRFSQSVDISPIVWFGQFACFAMFPPMGFDGINHQGPGNFAVGILGAS
jgi:hypothetical protein